MTTPITQIPKPEAGQYAGRRKLFLVPLFLIQQEAPDEGKKLFERLWTDVREHIQNLERSLGSVVRVYHEAVFEEGDEGLRMVEGLNPLGGSFIQALCQSTARVEATDNRALLEESADWQRCISIGLVSMKVMNTALEGYRNATDGRYAHIASRIDDTLKEGESGVLFIAEDHKVQFPTDVQVFYIAPPSLDALKRWIDDQARAARERFQQARQAAERDEPSEPEEPQEPTGPVEPDGPAEPTGPPEPEDPSEADEPSGAERPDAAP